MTDKILDYDYLYDAADMLEHKESTATAQVRALIGIGKELRILNDLITGIISEGSLDIYIQGDTNV